MDVGLEELFGLEFTKANDLIFRLFDFGFRIVDFGFKNKKKVANHGRIYEFRDLEI